MGYTTSAWQSWWAVDWHTGFVLQFSMCSAPANFQTNRFNAALLSPTHWLLSSPLSISCHSLPALLPVESCYIHKVCAPVTKWRNNWRCCRRHSLQCYFLLPYPHCFQKTERAALHVAGPWDMSRSQQHLTSQPAMRPKQLQRRRSGSETLNPLEPH